MVERYKINTKPEELKKFVSLLPRNYNPYLIAIGYHIKIPDVYRGDSWKDTSYRLTIGQALKRLERGLNVAIVMRGDMVAVDIDDVDDVPDLPDTLEVMSRNGRSHKFYLNDGNVGNRDISKVIELRTNWRYVVVAGSYVPPGKGKEDCATGVYTVLNNLPIATLSLDDLPKELHPDYRNPVHDYTVTKSDVWYNMHGDPLALIRKRDMKLDHLLANSNMYYRSGSEADMAACGKLWFWGYTVDEIASIMHQYRYREKFNRGEYLGRTISKISHGDRVSRSLLYDADEEEEEEEEKAVLANVNKENYLIQ